MKMAATSYQIILSLLLVCSLLLSTTSSFSLPSFMRRYKNNNNNNKVNVSATTKRTTRTTRLQATTSGRNTKQSDFLQRIQNQTRERLHKSATTKPAAVVVVEGEKEPTVLTTTPKQPNNKPSVVETTATDMQQQRGDREEENWLNKMVQVTKSSYLQNQTEPLPQYNDGNDNNDDDDNDNSNNDDDDKKQNPLLHVLAQRGPWTAYFDESEASIGLVYYFHQETGESQWSRPTENFPVVTLSDRLQKIAEERQQAYLEKRKSNEKSIVEKQKSNDSSVGGGADKDKNVPMSSSSRQKALLAAKVVAALKNSKRQKESVQENSAMQPLATEGDWEAHLDTQTSGFVYFWNKVTGQSQWTPPTTTFPTVEGYPQRPMPKAVSQITTTTATDLRPLATQGDWTAYFDGDRSCMVYYFNHNTGVSQWEKPSPNFPSIRLTERMRQRMLDEQLVQFVASTQDRGRPLAKQGDWVAYFDSNSMKIYYVNSATGASQWEKPTTNFPTVRLPNRMKKLMQREQQRQVVIEKQKYERPGLLTWLVDTVSHVTEERAATTTTTTAAAQRNTVKCKGSPSALAGHWADTFGLSKLNRKKEKKLSSEDNSAFLLFGGDHDDDDQTTPFFVSKRSG